MLSYLMEKKFEWEALEQMKNFDFWQKKSKI